jgi:hypothetical protein
MSRIRFSFAEGVVDGYVVGETAEHAGSFGQRPPHSAIAGALAVLSPSRSSTGSEALRLAVL